MRVLIRGAGDLASGIALRLHRAGLDVVMTDLEKPTAIRRTVCFSQALVLGAATVEDVTARAAASAAQAEEILAAGEIPVLADPACTCREALRPDALVDAILAKRNLGMRIGRRAPSSSASWPRLHGGGGLPRRRRDDARAHARTGDLPR